MTERSVHHLRQGIESRFLGFAGPQLLPHPGLLQTPVDHFDGTRARESCRFPRESSYNSSNRSATWKTSADAYCVYRRRRATHPVMSTDWRISVTAAIVSVQSTGDYSLFNARAALRIIKDSVLYIDEVLYKKGPTRPLSLGKPTDPIRGTAVAHNHGIMAESSTSRH